MGEVVNCPAIDRYEKVPVDKLGGTIVAERAFDMICLLLVFGLTLVFQFNVIHSLTSGKIDTLFRNASGQISYIKIIGGRAALLLLFLIAKRLVSEFRHICYVQKVKM